MMKRVLPGVVAFFGLCLFLQAQTNRLNSNPIGRTGLAQAAYQPDIFRAMDSAALIHGIPALTLADPGRYSFSSAWVNLAMGSVEPSPIFNSTDLPRVNSPPAAGTSSSGKPMVVSSDPNFYVGGEVGFLYGRSSGGKSSLDEKQTYIMGEIGNDKVHISVGASYDESNWHTPRLNH